uniref:Chemokine interleukin-8-like domain-containing protein n=1 Tax=Amphiprion percula TaxID=161767 RepID=A0A3P8TPB8_AMPPE
MVSTASAQGKNNKYICIHELLVCWCIISCHDDGGNMRILCSYSKEYYIEDSASCPLHAVVFTTMRGNRLCSDPVKLWTQTSMAYLDGKNWQKQHVTRNKVKGGGGLRSGRCNVCSNHSAMGFPSL